jgi:glutamate racemase
VAIDALAQALPIPVIGVIGPTARAASSLSKNGHIGVLGTPGTIRSGAYQRELENARPGVTVQSRACPLFVPLAEEGWTSGEVPRLVAQAYLEELKQSAVDTVVLGCTHYPLLRDVVQQVLGPTVMLVDAALATVQTVRQTLSSRGVLSKGARPTHRFFVTDVPGRFGEVGERFLGQPIGEAEQVDIVFSTPSSGK